MSAAAVSIGQSPGPSRARVAFIVGPTGVGKSAFALGMAERLDAEIVNGDSRQLYRGLDIGAAKPTAEERRRVPHHLIDIAPANSQLDAALFARLADAAIADIDRRGRRALVVGGSGLYIRALRDGIFPGPPASAAIRKELGVIAARDGVSALHARLAKIDPESAARLSPNDLKRVIRALEVFELTGTPLSAHHERHRRDASPKYASLTIGLDLPRLELYEAIDRRFAAMVENGLIDEVRILLDSGYDPASDALKTIGYAEITGYLRGQFTLDEAIIRAQQRSRNLAKRQVTWFRADPSVRWLDPRRDGDRALRLLENFLAGVIDG